MAQKTYWHLRSKQRIPSDYEMASSKLLYYPGRGFETATPVDGWYRKYQQESPFHCEDWELFADPRETTYAAYTSIQASQETFVDGLLTSIENAAYDEMLSPEWVDTFFRFIAPMRYPWHGFQMTACYVGQMAPGSRITITSMFQAADEIRRIQRIAYRTRQLQIRRPEKALDSLQLWTKDATWQPLRRAVEALLVVHDWGEAFVALNMVLKPFIDDLFLEHFSALASLGGDPILHQILRSFDEDCKWQRQWSQALVRTVLSQRAVAKKELDGWVLHWSQIAHDAFWGFEPVFRNNASPRETFQEIVSHTESAVRHDLLESGLASF